MKMVVVAYSKMLRRWGFTSFYFVFFCQSGFIILCLNSFGSFAKTSLLLHLFVCEDDGTM